MEECPICFNELDRTICYICKKCTNSFCLFCYQSLKKEECPFCRCHYDTLETLKDGDINNNYNTPPNQNEVNNNNNNYRYSYTYPPITHNNIPYWENSRIENRRLRREQKQYYHELQKIQNAELSRIHNHDYNNRNKRKSKQEKRNNLMFQIEDL